VLTDSETIDKLFSVKIEIMSLTQTICPSHGEGVVVRLTQPTCSQVSPGVNCVIIEDGLGTNMQFSYVVMLHPKNVPSDRRKQQAPVCGCCVVVALPHGEPSRFKHTNSGQPLSPIVVVR
jgi:hypothetical protein